MHASVLIFLAVCFVVPIFLGQMVEPTEHTWRVINIATVLTGGAGLFIILGEAARLIPANILPQREQQAKNWLKLLQSTISGIETEMCREPVRSQYSPSTFDHDVAQYRLACPWAKKMVQTLQSLKIDDLPAFTPDPLPSEITHQFIRQRAEQIAASVEIYTEQRNAVLALKDKLKRSAIEELAIFLGPFLAAIAFGLAWFKALWGPI